jgi:hypothetical protein
MPFVVFIYFILSALFEAKQPTFLRQHPKRRKTRVYGANVLLQQYT